MNGRGNKMKKLLKTFAFVFMISLLTGCMKLNMNIEVKSDKSMTGNMEILAEESMFESMGSSAEEYVEQMQQELLSNDEMKDAKVSKIDKTIDGSKWVGVNVTGLTGDSKGTVEEKEVDGKKSIVLTLPMSEMENKMDSSQLQQAESLGYSVSKLKALGLEMNLTVKMPAKATSNVGTVDGDTVKIDLLEIMAKGSSEDIVISSAVSGGMDMTLILIVLGVAIIAGGVFFVLKKKKDATQQNEAPIDEMPTQNAAPEESVQETTVEQTPVQEEPVQETVEEKPVEEVTEEKPVDDSKTENKE